MNQKVKNVLIIISFIFEVFFGLLNPLFVNIFDVFIQPTETFQFPILSVILLMVISCIILVKVIARINIPSFYGPNLISQKNLVLLYFSSIVFYVASLFDLVFDWTATSDCRGKTLSNLFCLFAYIIKAESANQVLTWVSHLISFSLLISVIILQGFWVYWLISRPVDPGLPLSMNTKLDFITENYPGAPDDEGDSD